MAGTRADAWVVAGLHSPGARLHIFWTAINWKPGDALWTELHVGTVVLAGLAFAMATRLRPSPARTPVVVRVVGALACMLAGIALVLVILMGTSEG
jgi:hypothetical protein